MQNGDKISLPEHGDLESLLCLRLRESPSHLGTRGLWQSLFQPLAQSRSSNEKPAWVAHAFIQACLENLPEASSFPGLPRPLLAAQVLQPPFSWWPSTEPAPVCPHLSCTVLGPKLDAACEMWSADCQVTAGTIPFLHLVAVQLSL